MRKWMTILGIAFLGLIGVTRADEEKIPLDKVPKVIMDTVKKRFPDAEVKGAEKEVEDGKTIYEVTLTLKGKYVDVSFFEDGKIQAIEKEIAMTDLPKAVADAFKSKYEKAKVSLIEEVIHVADGKESLAYYEFHIDDDMEVLILPNGQFKK